MNKVVKRLLIAGVICTTITGSLPSMAVSAKENSDKIVIDGTEHYVYGVDYEEGYSDSYKSSQYYKKLKKVELTYNQADNLVAIAESQVGYLAGMEDDYTGEIGNEENKKFAEYSRAAGVDGMNWCAAFITWCARQADIPTTVIKGSVRARDFMYFGDFYDIEEPIALPKKGDILLFEPRDEELEIYLVAPREEENGFYPETSSHVAIVAEDVTSVGGKLVYYEGNAKGMVKQTITTYRNVRGNSAGIQGFMRPHYQSERQVKVAMDAKKGIVTPTVKYKSESRIVSGAFKKLECTD